MTEDEDNTSSRVVVQSSSRDFSEASLEKKFSSTGLHISDMKVLKNANGQPRGVAFIGFRSIEDARSAKEHFDNTWYLGGKLKVQYARKVTPSIVGIVSALRALCSSANSGKFALTGFFASVVTSYFVESTEAVA